MQSFWSLVLFLGVPRGECDSLRTPGDKAMVEKRNKQYIAACAHVGGGATSGGCGFLRVIRYWSENVIALPNGLREKAETAISFRGLRRTREEKETY